MLSKLNFFFRLLFLALIITASGSLMLSAAWQDSAVVEEPENFNALTNLLPILKQNLDFQSSPDLALYWLRLVPIFLSLILILMVYWFSKELIGKWWALLAVLFLAFSPTFLAKGHYFTKDIGITLGIFIALISFLAFLFNRTKKNLFLAGLFFGLAQIIDFSLIFLIPLFTILIVIFYFSKILEDWPLTDPQKRLRRFIFRGLRYLKYLIAIFLTGSIIIYLFYFVSYWNIPTSENFFLKPINSCWSELNDYLRIDNPTFILGTIYDSTSIAYLPITLIFKEPLPAVIIIFASLLICFWKFIKTAAIFIFKRSKKPLEFLSTHFLEISIILTIVTYWLFGNQKILPILPFIYILTSESVKTWFGLENLEKARNFIVKIVILANELSGISVKAVILAILLIWLLISAGIAYPNFNSYFNLAAGGSQNGYKYLINENYDWGQDLKRLSRYIEGVNNDNDNNNDIDRIAVDYYDESNLKYYLGDKAESWISAKGTPVTDGINWLAISATNLQIAKAKIAGTYQRKSEDEYQWLENPYDPYARAGTILIYRLNSSR